MKTNKIYSENDNNGDGSIWKWLLPILLLVLSSWFLWKQCHKLAADKSPANSTAINRH